MNRRHRLEQRLGFGKRHLQDLVDILSAKRDRQGLLVVASSTAAIAVDVHVREKAHLHLDGPLPGARLAPPPLDVERESAGLEPRHTRRRRCREQLPDLVEEADVRCWDRAWRPADRGLIDLENAIEVVDSPDRVVVAGK